MDTLERYIETHSSDEEALLQELDRVTHLRMIQARMISGHIQGLFLKMVVAMLRPRNILEIGTFTGYSALCMAAGLATDGYIDTFETDDELQELAQSFFDRSEHGSKIRLHIGSALELAPQQKQTYDLVFVDGDKREYPAYYDMLFRTPLIHSGSFILADNILWYGKVTEPIAHNDRHTQAIDEFNRMVRDDDRVENVIMPIRDGLNIIRVK